MITASRYSEDLRCRFTNTGGNVDFILDSPVVLAGKTIASLLGDADGEVEITPASDGQTTLTFMIGGLS